VHPLSFRVCRRPIGVRLVAFPDADVPCISRVLSENAVFDRDGQPRHWQTDTLGRMKKKMLTFTALIASLVRAQDATRPSFEGTWLRDEIIGTKSKALPRITWTITFDEKAIALVESSEKGVSTRTPKYNLDGSEASYPVQNRPDGNSTRLILRQDRLIEVSETMPSQGGAGLKVSESWELTNGGKTLKVVRKFQIRNSDGPMPIGIADQVYSFQRVPPKQ
jgi:hypothetical protein